MRALGWDVPLHIKNAALLGNALGGVIFGAGMALLGYCPGTGVAAFGDGSRHALFGVLGMLVGAALFAEVYPWLKSELLGIGDLGKATLPSLTATFALVVSGVAECWQRRGCSCIWNAGSKSSQSSSRAQANKKSS